MNKLERKILITDRFHSDSLKWLKQQKHIQVEHAYESDVERLPELESYHGFITRSKTLIHRKLLKKAKALQVVVTATSGHDHIDLAACKEWGITVMHTPMANQISAAEHTWALYMASSKNIFAGQKQCDDGAWDRNKILSRELHRKKYGIVGLGRIGRRVARYARAFNLDVGSYDPYRDDDYFSKRKVHRFETLGELLRWCDVVSFHVPKNIETHHMLSQKYKEDLRSHVIIINTSRGDVIDSSFLLKFLQRNPKAKAALDVFEEEPLPRKSYLLHNPQIICSPHVGANTEEAFFKASQMAAQKIVRYFYDGSTTDTL